MLKEGYSQVLDPNIPNRFQPHVVEPGQQRVFVG